MDDKPRQIKRE
jgi:hypothetical protein